MNDPPAPGSEEAAYCQAAFFALITVLYDTDLMQWIKVVHCVGNLASKALLGASAPLLSSSYEYGFAA